MWSVVYTRPYSLHAYRILREPALTGCWMIPGQIAFLFLKHNMQNCCFVTSTYWTEFLVSHFNINEIFQASDLF